jgi:5-methylcytosine-specific restriction enzyme A
VPRGRNGSVMKCVRISDEAKRIVWDRAGGRCEMCGEAASDLQYHSRRWRQQSSCRRDPDSASNSLLLCLIDHHRVESHRSQAHEHGQLLRAGQSPVVEPVVYRGVWMLLDDDGFTYRIARPNIGTAK